MKLHLNNDNELKKCTARPGRCIYEDQPHFDSEEEAYEHIEKISPPIKKLTKKDPIKETSYTLDLDKGVLQAIDGLSEIGRPLVVGGAVRDSLDGYENKDIDLEVYSTDVDTIIKTMKSKGYYVDAVGKQFGVIKVSKKGTVNDLDVSVPREENRTGTGHKAFEVRMDKELTISEAVNRRDFTFNALMYDPKKEVLIDAVDGQKDFNNHVIRHISDRFKEDPLRVLRGFQFAGRFNMKYAPETSELAKNIRNEYSVLSVERVREEWGKFYTKSKKPSAGIKALQDSGWDDTLPGLRNALKNESVSHNLDSAATLDQEDKTHVSAAIISRQMNENDAKTFNETTLPRLKDSQWVNNLIHARSENLSTTLERKQAAEQKHFTFKKLESFARATNDKELLKVSQKAKSEGIYTSPETPLLDGNYLIKNSTKKAGPWIKETLNKVKRAQYSGEITTRKQAEEYADELLKE